jgi:hypothetical protein
MMRMVGALGSKWRESQAKLTSAEDLHKAMLVAQGQLEAEVASLRAGLEQRERALRVGLEERESQGCQISALRTELEILRGSGQHHVDSGKGLGEGWGGKAIQEHVLYEEQISSLSAQLDALQEELGGMKRSKQSTNQSTNQALQKRVREAESDLRQALSSYQALSLKHAELLRVHTLMRTTLAAANSRVDLLLGIPQSHQGGGTLQAKGPGLESSGGAPPEFAVRARQLLELYQRSLSDYQTLEAECVLLRNRALEGKRLEEMKPSLSN